MEVTVTQVTMTNWKISSSRSIIGFSGENEVHKLEILTTPENGVEYTLEIKSQFQPSNIVELEVEEGKLSVLLTSEMLGEDGLKKMQVVGTLDEQKKKSNWFEMIVEKSINAESDIAEHYPSILDELLEKINSKQDKLTAGNGIDIDSINNAISAKVRDLGDNAITNNQDGLYVSKYTLGFDTDLRQNLTNVGASNALASKSYVDSMLSGAIKRLVVQTLPVSDIDENTIYMLPKPTAETNNIYYEYMYINNAWELIGTTEVDLSNYYTKTEVDNLISANMSLQVKKAIYGLLENATYTNNDNAAGLNTLKDWVGTFTVTNNLTHCTTSNDDTSVIKNDSYTATITADQNYVINTVTVTMGGVDITSTAYDNGVITIADVTGNIVITIDTVIDWDNGFVITQDKLVAGKISENPPYYTSASNRVSYVGVDILVEYGYKYTVTGVFKSGVTPSSVGVQQLNTDVYNKVLNSESFPGGTAGGKHDSGWQTNGYTATILEAYKGYPIECIWICFNTSAVSNIEKVTITREAV